MPYTETVSGSQLAGDDVPTRGPALEDRHIGNAAGYPYII